MFEKHHNVQTSLELYRVAFFLRTEIVNLFEVAIQPDSVNCGF